MRFPIALFFDFASTVPFGYIADGQQLRGTQLSPQTWPRYSWTGPYDQTSDLAHFG